MATVDHVPGGGRRTELAVSIALAIAYTLATSLLPTLSTGMRTVDAVIGVVLGLYICSHPAANAIDLLFMDRGGFGQTVSGWSGIGWLALNLAALAAGWLVITIGATRLVD